MNAGKSLGIDPGPSFGRKVDVETKKKSVDFENEEEEEQSKTIRFENEEEQQTDINGCAKDGLAGKFLMPEAAEEANTSSASERRSRRESPRKHLTVNSRVKPVLEPVIGVDWWPASPAFESPQMSTLVFFLDCLLFSALFCPECAMSVVCL